MNVKKDIVPRLYFNQAEFEPGEIDPGKLKNDLDSAKLSLRQKEKEKDELRKECKSKEVCKAILHIKLHKLNFCDRRSEIFSWLV